MNIHPPQANEYAAFNASYVARVSAADVTEVLRAQAGELRTLLSGVPDEQARTRPAPAEWSINEVIGHVTDGERIFAYRMLRIARGDTTPLPGFEQDDYILPGKFNARTLSSLFDEFAVVRRATLGLVETLDDEMLSRMGTVSNNPTSARALLFIIAGHVDHHIESLRTVYLGR
jgi:DinB superfamily